MKKIAKILLLAMLISVFASACGSAEPEVFDMDFVKEAGKIDLEGIEIVYEIGLTDAALAYDNCLGYELDTQFGDLAVQRLKDVQENLNCVVKTNYVNNGVSCRNFVACSASGTFMCDVISGTSDMWADVARIGMVIGMSELEDYIDFRNEAKWGYRNMLEVVYYEDDLYGLVPLLWPEVSVSYGSPLVVNEHLISSLGVTDPRDYLENGEWTWEKFREVLELYYVKEGSEVKHYALTCSDSVFGGMFILSNGSHYAEKAENGEYIPGFFTARAMKAMDEGIDIFHGTLGETIDKKTDAVEAILGGTTVMSAVHSHQIIGLDSRIAKEMEDFGILSWPTGPDVEPGYSFGSHNNIARCFAFSRVSKHPDVAATIINAIYEPFEGYETLDSIIDL
ncbi:MAG: hypothetical protein IJB44_02305, partial [Clostridia bacterium]|nr:hypothetical protein [Clostridia bacterium]